jgi:hypothetical protein
MKLSQTLLLKLQLEWEKLKKKLQNQLIEQHDFVFISQNDTYGW